MTRTTYRFLNVLYFVGTNCYKTSKNDIFKNSSNENTAPDDQETNCMQK